MAVPAKVTHKVTVIKDGEISVYDIGPDQPAKPITVKNVDSITIARAAARSAAIGVDPLPEKPPRQKIRLSDTWGKKRRQDS